jgi:hypothetical protein
MVKLTGWDPDTLKAFAEGFKLQAADYRNEKAFLRLDAAARVINWVGVSPVRLFQWAPPGATAARSEDIRSAVRANYSDSDWQGVAVPLANSLREKKRSALVSLAKWDDRTNSPTITSSRRRTIFVTTCPFPILV